MGYKLYEAGLDLIHLARPDSIFCAFFMEGRYKKSKNGVVYVYFTDTKLVEILPLNVITVVGVILTLKKLIFNSKKSEILNRYP